MDDDTNAVAQDGLDALSDQVASDLGINDEPTNEASAQPQAQPAESQEQPQEVPEQPAEAPSEPEAPLTNQSPEPPAQPEETEDEVFEQFQPTYGNVPALDLSRLPQDEDGNVDANALAQAIAQRDQALLSQAANMVQQAEERREEEKLWNKAFEAHPELRSDKALAEEVNALRFGLFAKDINSGKQSRMLSPTQAYQRLNKRFAQAEAKGVQQATESVKVQESVYTQPTANAGSASADDSDLFRKMRSPNRAEADAAADAILSRRLFGE